MQFYALERSGKEWFFFMSDAKIIKSQSEEEAQAKIDALFSAKPAPSHAPGKVDAKREYIPPENGDKLAELPIDLLDDFATGTDKQPFRPYSAEELEELSEDITRRGILQPPIVRPKANGRYEIIAGHNRRDGAKAAGYTTMPCIVRSLTDDEAILQMVSTNLQQRKKLLPSEKAQAYKLQMDAMNRQGFRSDLTSRQIGAKSRDSRSDEQLAVGADDSARQILRYIRLTYLTPGLLAQVDASALGLTVGATLSYITPTNQLALERYAFVDRKLHISQDLADALRQADADGTIFSAETLPLLVQLTAESKRKMAVSGKVLRRFFPAATTQKAVEKTVSAALKRYFEQGGQICE